MPKYQGLHIAMQFPAKPFMVFAVHLAEVSYLIFTKDGSGQPELQARGRFP